MGITTENSVKGELIILAFAIGGAVLLSVVGHIAMGFVAEWLWVPPAGPSIPKGVDGATWGGLSIGEWLSGLFVGPNPEPGKPDFAKMIHVATYRLWGVIGGFALGAGMGAWLALRYLSRAKDP